MVHTSTATASNSTHMIVSKEIFIVCCVIHSYLANKDLTIELSMMTTDGDGDESCRGEWHCAILNLLLAPPHTSPPCPRVRKGTAGYDDDSDVSSS